MPTKRIGQANPKTRPEASATMASTAGRRIGQHMHIRRRANVVAVMIVMLMRIVQQKGAGDIHCQADDGENSASA